MKFRKYLLFIWALFLSVLSAKGQWGGDSWGDVQIYVTPGPYFSGTPYTVSATGYYFEMPGYYAISGNLSLYKNNQYVAGGYNDASYTSTETGPGRVYYYANGNDVYGGSYGANLYVDVQDGNKPKPTISVDGHASGATVTRVYDGAVVVTVRFKATDSDNNLTGIRPNVWRPDGSLDNNGGAYVSQSGGSGEVVWSVALNQNGAWRFWTESRDANGNEVSTGTWNSGFVINVNEAANRPPVVQSVTADKTSLYAGQSTTIRVRATDADGNLRYINLDRISHGGGHYGPGSSFNADSPPSNGAFDLGSKQSDYTRNVTMLFPSAGSFRFRGAANDNSGWYYNADASDLIINVTGANDPHFNSYSVSPETIQVGGNLSVTWSAGDVDGDFSKVDAYVTQWGSPYWDHLGSFGATGSVAWSNSEHFSSNNGGYNTYLFVLVARDGRGGSKEVHVPFSINRPPSASIVASASTVYIGQPITLTATITDPDANLSCMGILRFDGSTYHRPMGINYTRTGWNSYAADTLSWYSSASFSDDTASGGTNTKTIKFTPQTAGTYQFHSNGHDNMVWAGGSTVAVKAAKRPTATITADNPAPFVGQSTTIRATFTGDSANGDPITLTAINMVDGTETSVTEAQSGNQNWTFTPSHAGTYTFKAYAKTTLSPDWAVYATCTVTAAVSHAPIAALPSGPTTVYKGSTHTYTFAGTDIDGDLASQETYFAEPGATFGASVATWPNLKSFKTSGSSVSNTRAITFSKTGSWQIRQRISDSTGWYTMGTSPNWSPVLTVAAVDPVRNAQLEWWGQHSDGAITADQRIAGGGGDKKFFPGSTITLRGFCVDSDGIRDVDSIRVQIINPASQTIADWSSNESDSLNTNSDGSSRMDRQFTFPSTAIGNFTVRVTTKMSGGIETVRNFLFAAITDIPAEYAEWARNHGLNPNDTADLLADPDGDGLTNIAEFNLGTNPNQYDNGTSLLGGTIPAGWPQAVTSEYAVGTTTGEFNVDKSGSATYTIPFSVSPGTAGMEPKMSLAYSSQSNSSVAGYGWMITGQSAVTRGPQTKLVDGQDRPVDFSRNDRYYLDGQRLIAISGEYGADGTEYRTELESFARVVSYGSSGEGPAYFKVWTKAGLIFEYGNTSGSAFKFYGRSEITSWSVNKVSDTLGNYMEYLYENDSYNGQQLLTAVNYTGYAFGSETLQPYASLVFDYEARPDVFSGYMLGYRASGTKRLKSVRSLYGTEEVRRYDLTYIQRPYNNRSILASLTESGRGGIKYKPLVFDYSNPEDGMYDVEASKWAPPPIIAKAEANRWLQRGYGVMFIDIDGDGYPDCLQRSTNSAWLNKASGWVQAHGANGQPDYRLPISSSFPSTSSATSCIGDFNGDGLPDVMDDYGNAYLNTGSGFALSAKYSTGLTGHDISTLENPDVRRVKAMAVDLNGDGRVDICVYTQYEHTVWEPEEGGSIYNLVPVRETGYVNEAWINTGDESGATVWQYGGHIPGFHSDETRILDLNGDGLVDSMQYSQRTYATSPMAWLNTRAGWASSSAYNPPMYLIENKDDKYGMTEIVDLNGDGYPDLVARNKNGLNNAYLNTGAGWVQAPTSLRAPIEMYANFKSTGGVFLDINNDGLTDFLQAYHKDSSGTYRTFLGTGSGWTTPISNYNLSRPWYYANVDGNPGTEFVDLNADGAIDVVWNWDSGNGYTSKGARLNKRANPDKLTKVTNGHGVSVGVTYQPLTARDANGTPLVYEKGTGAAFPIFDIIDSSYVVSAVAHDDGTGGAYSVEYRYGGFRSEVHRGSLGFKWMQVTDKRSLLTVKTVFSQEYPTVGMPLGTYTKKSDGTILSENIVTYATRTLNGGLNRFPYCQEAAQISYELNGALTSESVTTYEYDDFGNATKVEIDTVDQSGQYIRTTTSAYENWVEAPSRTALKGWMLGRLVSSSAKAVAPGAVTQTRTTGFAYNATTGLLNREIVEPQRTDDSPLKLVTEYTHDKFGNTISAVKKGFGLGASGRKAETTYDARGRLVESVKNALGQIETHTYDQAFGRATKTVGPNGLATMWEYDGFARVCKETRADGTISVTRQSWVGSGAPVGAKYFIETEATGSAPALSFFDAMGRAIAGYSINGGGADGNARITVTRTAYDSNGRAYTSSLPHYLNEPEGNIRWSQTLAYDILDRPLTMVVPDDEAPEGSVTTTMVYEGLTGTTTNPLGQREFVEKNARGLVVKRINNLGATNPSEQGEVSYTYDAFDSLLTVSVYRENHSAPVTTSFVYDGTGRKISMSDPDMGTWSYSYNALGELIAQTDAKGNLTTMAYDVLGRLVQREDSDAVVTWTYDTAPGKGVGKVHRVDVTSKRTSAENSSEVYAYDSWGRMSSLTKTIEMASYQTTQQYDDCSRPTVVTYPSGFKLRNVYNEFGYLKEIRAAGGLTSLPGEVVPDYLFWQADGYSVSGAINASTFGNGLTNDRVYSPVTGRVTSISSGRGVQYQTLHQQYWHDRLGQVVRSLDSVTGQDESYAYDGLNRLVSYQHGGTTGATPVTMAYNAMGNITNKSDLGNYAYESGRPHALTSAGGQVCTYDANGNMTSGGGRTFEWAASNQVRKITAGTVQTLFYFGAANERTVQKHSDGTTTTYIGANFEKVVNRDGMVEWKHYITTPHGRSAIRTVRGTTAVETRYLHQDALGSIIAVSDERGRVEKRFAYDPWGNRRTLIDLHAMRGDEITRGFTDHEHLSDFGLIHMNGRIFDPKYARFMSADPFVTDKGNSQAFNRYSYCENDPVNHTDPTGYFSLRSFFTGGSGNFAIRYIGMSHGVCSPIYLVAPSIDRKIGPMVTNAVVTAVVSYFAGPIIGGFAGSAAGHSHQALLNGESVGDAFFGSIQSGMEGAATAAVSTCIGNAFGARGSYNSWREVGRATAHGIVGGVMAEIQGGEFRHGFYSSFASSILVGGTEFGDKSWQYVAARTATAALIGGTVSVIGGGKFANGAITSAIQHLANHEGKHNDPELEKLLKRTVVIDSELYDSEFVRNILDWDFRYLRGEFKSYIVNSSTAPVGSIEGYEQAVQHAKDNGSGYLLGIHHGGGIGEAGVTNFGKETYMDSVLRGILGKYGWTDKTSSVNHCEGVYGLRSKYVYEWLNKYRERVGSQWRWVETKDKNGRDVVGLKPVTK